MKPIRTLLALSLGLALAACGRPGQFKTRLIAVTHMSNVTGTVVDVGAIARGTAPSSR